ncbi:MAG: GNAT family N-acetyltransferase [Armatimonadetes bacterium]|nr:GNAT family N-acetyltransferase [Armatimonadota bacterium]MDE2206492.1 GNAT family N-acetyltransferase [Armatimonadota bacterium]
MPTDALPVPTVRRAGVRDAEQVAALWLRLMNEHHELDRRLPGVPPGTRLHLEHARRLLTGRDWHVWVAEEPLATTLLGFVAGSTRVPSPFMFTGNEAWIADLYVTPEWRRRGVAGNLVRALLRDFSLKQGATVQLCAAASNPAAVGFWRAQAFETVLHLMQLSRCGTEQQEA